METLQILEIANASQENIQKIESNLFEVVKKPLLCAVDGYDAPTKHFGVYVKDGGECLSVAGNTFAPTQPRVILEGLKVTALESHLVDLSKLSFNSYRGNRSISFNLELDPISFKNAAGKEDETKVYMSFTTSFDGTSANKIKVFTWRQICSNGMMGYGIEGSFSARNTKNASDKVVTYLNEFNKTLVQIDTYKESLVALNKVKVSKSDVDDFVKRVFEVNKENVSQRTLNKLKEVNEAIDFEMSRTGQTAYGMLQGITYYTNHIENTSKEMTNEEYILFGTGKNRNDIAQRAAFQLL